MSTSPIPSIKGAGPLSGYIGEVLLPKALRSGSILLVSERSKQRRESKKDKIISQGHIYIYIGRVSSERPFISLTFEQVIVLHNGLDVVLILERPRHVGFGGIVSDDHHHHLSKGN